MVNSIDFIVVGSGPAGCMIASTISRSHKKPQVLLLEAGAKNLDPTLRIDGQRQLTFLKNPHMNWGYKTIPQEHCANREIDYSRGKCLGGSSAINFGAYTIGPRDDYNEWARLVDDDSFKWDQMQPRFKAIETFHGPTEIVKGFAAPKASDHGYSGPIHVGYPTEWEKDITEFVDIIGQAGYPLSKDHNSGDPLGMTVLISSAHNGIRSTAADALESHPDNLAILTDSPVQRLLFEGKRVIGVESNRVQFFASKEVILSAGALDSPRILLHSGIGPIDQLNKYKIPVIQNSPVGQGLRDHIFVSLVYSRTADSTERGTFYGNQERMDTALEQWKTDQTGDWAKFGCGQGTGWFKSDRITSSEEFKALPATEQEFLHHESVPHYEFSTHFPIHFFIPDYPSEHLSYSTLAGFLLNSQVRGEVTLQSSDPNLPLKFDPKFLSHPFDRRVAIEILRDMLKVTNNTAFTKDTVAPIAVPKSDSDQDLLEYWQQTLNSSWHMTGTAKMGKPEDPDTVVDSQFRVLGIEGLRVADMSVLPILPNGHTQAPAYVTGVTCAEKLVKEYGLA